MDGNINEHFFNSHGELVLFFNMNCHLYEVFSPLHTTSDKFENVAYLFYQFILFYFILFY